MGALDLAAIEADVATTTVPYSGAEINVSYRPSIATPNRIQRVMATVDDENADLTEFIGFISELLAGWDIVRAGVPVPVTPDGVGSVPFPVLRTVMMKVMEASTDVGEARSSSAAG